MNQNFGGNGFGQQQNFQQPQQNQQQFQQPQQQNNFQQPQQFQQQGGGMFVDNNQAPSAGNGPLPKGHYPVRITNAEYKENNSQTGWILAIENTVTDGHFVTRKIFDNYNMQHQNEIAQNIGQANYAKLCQSIFGNPQNRPQNPAALIGAEYVIDYGAQRKKKSTNNTYQPEADENEEATMEVKDRLPITSYNAGAQQQPQQQVMSQQAFNQQPQQPSFGQPLQQQMNGQVIQPLQQQTQQAQPGFHQQIQPQQQFNQQQQPQQDFNQQQAQQAQQQGFQQQSGNVSDPAQAGAGNQQGAALQPAQNQGQNGNGQGNGAPQGDNSANANPGNVKETPFNQGAGNGFGGGFGSM